VFFDRFLHKLKQKRRRVEVGRAPVSPDGNTTYFTGDNVPSERDMAACHRWQREERARYQFVSRHGASS
jgi:hypothetical protein